MEIETIDDVIHWINRQPDFESVFTRDVLRRARQSNIPAEARAALQTLPARRFTRAELVAETREVLLPHVPLR
jgi:hypothetical protein